MKKTILVIIVAALCSLFIVVNPALAQGTAFTYQGLLNTNGVPYSGSAEFQFTLWDAVSVGNAVATNNPTSVIATVASGLFTVTLDFGINPFNGQPRFLETAVRTVIGPFTTLTPRQPLTATPYALRALNLTTNGLAGTYGNAVTFNNAGNSFAGAFTGTVSGDGSGMTNVNAATLNGLTSANFWKTNGNAGANPTNGAFLGTTDNLPLELKVNGTRVLRLEPTASASPNVIGGSPVNFVAPGVVGATISGGGATNISGISNVNSNSVLSDFGAIGGGARNTIRTNQINSSIGGGFQNEIGGVPGIASAVGVPGYNFIGGGSANSIYPQATLSVILGGGGNTIQTNTSTSTISGGSGNIIAASVNNSTIAGGSGNTIVATGSAIGGGVNNQIIANVNSSTVDSFIGGGAANVIGGSSFGVSLFGGNFIGGGANSSIRSDSDFSVIAGGYQNTINTNADYATIAGGQLNDIGTNSADSVIGGGFNNNIGNNSVTATIAGGQLNDIGTNSDNSVISGGNNNNIGANSPTSVIGGGNSNNIPANAAFATIPGGDSNTATNYAFAAGRRASAIHVGAFVWGDNSTNVIVSSTASNSVTMRAAGGYRLYSSAATNAGVFLAAGGTAWAVISDRNVKKDFAPIDRRGILEKLAAMPITQWHYQWEEESITPHIGPMAQDFKAAFYPGSDDKSITTQDADGVALAAIQGLNEKVESGKRKAETQIEKLTAENAELKAQLTELKILVKQLAEARGK